MTASIVFDPLINMAFVVGLGAVALVLLGFGIWRGLPGWMFRAVALIALVAALLNPLWKQEDRAAQQDIVLVIVDDSSSQTLSDRAAQTVNTLAQLEVALGKLDDALLVEIHHVGDAGRDGTLLLTALTEAAGAHSANRIAAAILISDGRIHDADVLSNFPAPVHFLTTGVPQDWDRRVIVKIAPAYGIVGEPVQVVVRVEDLGAAPAASIAVVIASVDGGDEQSFSLPINEDVPLSLAVEHGGINLLEIRTPVVDGELTGQNNRAILSVNGVRDRLRVLLVSGEPYAGERTWRNLLKADSSVDLVHFTILRPPNKQDGVPYDELSLIAFPTQELFMDKIDDFDLIIFDRFRRQGVLPEAYLENVARYVRDGGAILVASGPAFAGVESLYRTPLRDILPAAPTGRVIEEGFVPLISDIGMRHPVTEGLSIGLETDNIPTWGRWFRIIETIPTSGYTLMEGPDQRPLLQLDRVGKGRLALLTSDHAWLWSRGFEGGGPQRELLRRLAHWLMQEPELEENVLRATALGMSVIVDRQMLDGDAGDLTVVAPSGETQILTFAQLAPGRWRLAFEATESGVYRLNEGIVQTVVATGPATPIEFENPIATAEILAPLVDETGGASFLIFSGIPNFRQVAEGRVSAGRNWAGLVRRNAYLVNDVSLIAVAKGWMYLLIAALFSIVAWRVEGR
ncbi:MAG: hypothetical protein JKY31_13810 [Rhodobacteraceae bacterium]|nr:hypothetical protein [Paracoccaceae bacterium]